MCTVEESLLNDRYL